MFFFVTLWKQKLDGLSQIIILQTYCVKTYCSSVEKTLVLIKGRKKEKGEKDNQHHGGWAVKIPWDIRGRASD